eukprot:6147629-Prymnesium_polylepis.1
MHSGRRAEAAHLFQPNLAPNLKMLSSARQHRAGLFDVGVCEIQLEGFGSDLRGSSEFSGRGWWSRNGPRPAPAISHSIQGWLRGRSNFRCPPYIWGYGYRVGSEVST